MERDTKFVDFWSVRLIAIHAKGLASKTQDSDILSENVAGTIVRSGERGVCGVTLCFFIETA
jgi:hypothetical protein